jgi:hypothetical protein
MLLCNIAAVQNNPLSGLSQALTRVFFNFIIGLVCR